MELQKSIRNQGVVCALRIDLSTLHGWTPKQKTRALTRIRQQLRLADFHTTLEDSLCIVLSDKTALNIFRAIERLRLGLEKETNGNGRDDLTGIRIWDYKNKAHYSLTEDEIRNGLAEVSGTYQAAAPVSGNGQSNGSIKGHLNKRIKRLLDVFLASLALTICLPIMAAIAVAVKISSPGPAIYSQMRVGQEGKPFRFYKFRSMRQDADEKLHREYVTKLINREVDRPNLRNHVGPIYKLAEDYRLTPVGRFLRDFSLDELPQLYNVIRGDMSLVGPRPAIGYEVDCYEAWHLQRLQATPGLTGLWQVKGRSRTTFDEMVRFDIQYIRRGSIWLDLKILANTIKVVLAREGAA